MKIILTVVFLFLIGTTSDNSKVETCNIDGESISNCSAGGLPDKCCSYWNNKSRYVTYFPITEIELTCETGGEEVCQTATCTVPIEN